MASSSRRAVLTGIGLVTPLGFDPDSFWEALRAGKSGVRPISNFDASALPVRIGGEVRGFDARDYVDKKGRKQLKFMVPTIQFAVAGAQLAMNDSKVDTERLDPSRFGVAFGAGTVPSDSIDLGTAAQISTNGHPGQVDMKKWGAEGIPLISPMWMLNHVPNMLASHVSILQNAQGPNNSITQTDVAALLAIGEGVRVLRRDKADIMLVGGADAKINPITMIRQCLFAPLSRRNDAPEKASRPFERQRDGLVLGEGAGVLVLEDLEHARRRGARIYGEVVGFGAAFDARRSGSGLARAVRVAVAQAGIGPQDLDHINAQGYSVPDRDVWEARGLHEVFGRSLPPVFAGKSYLGNLGAASAATELAASLLALTHGLLPATLNYDLPDPACPLPVAREPRPVRKPYFLKVSFTELGQCAAVVCRRFAD